MLYEFFEKVYALEKQGKGIIKLNVGEPDWKPSKQAVRTANEALRNGKTNYGSAAGEMQLREKLAELHGCKPSNIVITPGSKFGIHTLLMLSLSKGDSITFFSPHWTAYELMCKSLGAEPRIVKLSLEDKWKADVSKIDISERTKFIILNSPCNPTSQAMEEKEEKELIESARKKGVHVIADDAYRDLCFDGRKERQLEEGLIIANSFSKTFGMTGWRIGYMVAPEEIAKRLISHIQITVTNVPVFLQLGAARALEDKKKIADKVRRVCRRRAGIAIKTIGDLTAIAKPNAGFYIFPKLLGKMDGLQFANLLLEQGVAIAPGAAFGDFQQHVRISLCAEEKKLALALGVIRNMLSKAE